MLGKQIRCLKRDLAHKETFASAADNLRALARRYPRNFCDYLATRIKEGEFSQNDIGDRRIFLIFLIEGREQYFMEILAIMLSNSPTMFFLLMLIAEKVLAVITELSKDTVALCSQLAAEKGRTIPQIKEIASILELAERQII